MHLIKLMRSLIRGNKVNIFEKALNFATSKEILADTCWSADYVKNLLGLENYNHFQENRKESVLFYGPVHWNGEKIRVCGNMSRCVSQAGDLEKIDLFINFEGDIPGIDLDWLYETSHLSFEEPEKIRYPFARLPIYNSMLEGYNVKVMIFVELDNSVTGFRADLIKQVKL